MGWFVVSVLTPVFMPVVLIVAVKIFPAAQNLKLMDTLKDGQLCWFALTLSCSTFYDLLQNDASPRRIALCGPAMAGTAFIGGVCGLYAVVAALQPTPLLVAAAGSPNTVRVWLGHYIVFVASAVLSAIVALLSLWIHNVLP